MKLCMSKPLFPLRFIFFLLLLKAIIADSCNQPYLIVGEDVWEENTQALNSLVNPYQIEFEVRSEDELSISAIIKNGGTAEGNFEYELVCEEALNPVTPCQSNIVIVEGDSYYISCSYNIQNTNISPITCVLDVEIMNSESNDCWNTVGKFFSQTFQVGYSSCPEPFIIFSGWFWLSEEYLLLPENVFHIQQGDWSNEYDTMLWDITITGTVCIEGNYDTSSSIQVSVNNTGYNSIEINPRSSLVSFDYNGCASFSFVIRVPQSTDIRNPFLIQATIENEETCWSSRGKSISDTFWLEDIPWESCSFKSEPFLVKTEEDWMNCGLCDKENNPLDVHVLNPINSYPVAHPIFFSIVNKGGSSKYSSKYRIS